MRVWLVLLMLAGLPAVPACRRGTESPDTSRLLKRTKVTVRTDVLDDYCGVYRLPSGALLRIFRQDQRLMAGSRPFELFAQLMKHQEPARRAEWEHVAETQRQARRAWPLPKMPILQISGAAKHQTHTASRDKVRFYEHWLAEHVPHAKHVLAEKSGHAVFVSQPELVVREIRALLQALRDTPTPPAR